MIIEHPVAYEYDGKPYEGMLVYDDSVTEKRPAIFMQPDWLGVCSHTTGMAAEAAETDYVVLLADMFGKNYGGEGKTHEELGKAARDRRSDIDFILGCGSAADAALTAEAEKLGLIDNSKRGAIGYCMAAAICWNRFAAAPISRARSSFTSPCRSRSPRTGPTT